MGSIGAADLIAKLVFVLVLALGIARGEIRYRTAALFVAIAVAVGMGLPLLPYGAPLVITALAVLDIVLVLVVLKGDVRI
jgi:hypothetical protein